ncbi:TPA: acetyltransferase [Thermocrinis Great Boiling Spring virus]|jgi:Acetyltransferases|nr:TPA: acetyltransferase [Thermocrinis Great Boiling Spring virus]
MIRKAKLEDLEEIKAIADKNRNELGFSPRGMFVEHIKRNEVYVAEYSGKVVGFVCFHHCRDGWTTIYKICVDKEYRRKGFGKALLKAVENEAQKIRLKCPAEIEANNFYATQGYICTGVEKGKKRHIAIWKKVIK